MCCKLIEDVERVNRLVGVVAGVDVLVSVLVGDDVDIAGDVLVDVVELADVEVGVDVNVDNVVAVTGTNSKKPRESGTGINEAPMNMKAEELFWSTCES